MFIASLSFYPRHVVARGGGGKAEQGRHFADDIPSHLKIDIYPPIIFFQSASINRPGWASSYFGLFNYYFN